MILSFEEFILESYEIEDRIITYEEVIAIHDEMIAKYGGMKGIRDEQQLRSCLDKPYMSVFGEDLYPTIYKKCAAILECMINTHPFSDGNKRTAFYVVRTILNKHGIPFTKDYDKSRQFIVHIFTKKINIDGIVRWIKRNCKKPKPVSV